MAGFGWAGAAGAVQAEQERQAKAAQDLQNALAERAYNAARAQREQGLLDLQQKEFENKQAQNVQRDKLLGEARAGLPAGTPGYVGPLVQLGEMSAVPKPPAPPEPYTLGPEQVRFGPQNQEVARGPERRPTAGEFEWVSRPGMPFPVQVPKGTAQLGDKPYKEPTAPSEINELRADMLRQQMADAAQKKDLARTSAVAASQDTIDVIKQLADIDPATGQLALKSATQNLYGLRNPIAQYIPGSETATAKGALDRLKGKAIIDLIQEMKAQSRTGATGFGQLSGRELSVLENAATQLSSANISDEAARTELQRIYDIANQAAGGGRGTGAGGRIRARDQNGVLHEAAAGTALPAGWKPEP